MKEREDEGNHGTHTTIQGGKGVQYVQPKQPNGVAMKSLHAFIFLSVC